MSVPQLKKCCQLCIIHHIVGNGYSNEVYQQQQQFLLNQLDEGAWGVESLAIFDKLVKNYGYFLPPMVILALLPNTTKELCLKECPALTEECLNAALESYRLSLWDTLNRCQLLQTLDITENPLLSLSTVHLFGSTSIHSFTSLSSVVLEDCSQVKDFHVQTLLRNAPGLHHLNIARCDITDQVFLLDEQKQLAREACLEIKDFTSVFDSHLQSVDVSRCSEFTSTGVRHLCTLCGPTLRSVNLAWSKVDCTAFLYLSGLGLPGAVDFFMSSGAMSSEVMEPLVYNLHQFDAICQDIVEKWKNGSPRDSTHGSYMTHTLDTHTDLDIEDIHPHFISSDPNRKGSYEVAPESSINTSCFVPYDPCDINVNVNVQPSLNCETNICSTEAINSPLTSGKCSPTFQDNSVCNLLQEPESCSKGTNQEEYCQGSSCVTYNIPSSHIEKESDSDLLDICSIGNDDNVKGSVKNDTSEIKNISCDGKILSRETTHYISHPPISKEKHVNLEEAHEANSLSMSYFSQTGNELAGHDVAEKHEEVADESDNHQAVKNNAQSEDKFFFNSDINSISLTATVFREETLSLRCFHKLLTTNDNILSLSLYGGINANFLSDNVLDLIGTYARGLEYLSVEGSDKLTPVGIIEIAQKCKKLSSLDLTGVSFVGDEGIIPLVESLPLTHLKLAETRITGVCLNRMAYVPMAHSLQELNLSWCEEIENDTAIDKVISSCPRLEKLMLRECCKSSTTLACIARHSHHLTELSLASNMSVMLDEGFILLTENLPMLTTIDLGWNSYLTNPSIEALLSNCPVLAQANLEGLKLLTSTPFLPLISVPDKLCVFLEERYSVCWDDPEKDFNVELSDLPCLPHRSSTYSTQLRYVNLTYSDFVDEEQLQQIVTITHGGIEMLDYYGNKVEPSKTSLQKYLTEFVKAKGKRD